MLRCLNLLETPDSGTLSAVGETPHFRRDARGQPEKIDHRRVERLRRSVGMVFKNFNLWSHMTVLENVIETRRMRSTPACWWRTKRRASPGTTTSSRAA
ncbi:ABC-type histidine transport system ATPase subunit [Ancylobacter sp. 3268]|nr:hypothetical protein [Ancylobacter sp. 3268]MDR6954045.1 ABC-type histidine transport system ATPase subunit [Ancylobacter sp. 3268]